MPRKAVEWALRTQKVQERLMTTVISLYVEPKARVKTVAGTSEGFDIRVGVH